MVGPTKILTVSYGTFSCTLEGFDEPFTTMKAIAEYFRDLAAQDRYFGAEPPTPDAEMLHRIAEREVHRRVEARVAEQGIVLRQTEEGTLVATPAASPEVVPAAASAPAAAAEPEIEAPVVPATAPVDDESVAAKLMRIRAAVAASHVATVPAEAAFAAASESDVGDVADDALVAAAEPTADADFDFAIDMGGPSVEEEAPVQGEHGPEPVAEIGAMPAAEPEQSDHAELEPVVDFDSLMVDAVSVGEADDATAYAARGEDVPDEAAEDHGAPLPYWEDEAVAAETAAYTAGMGAESDGEQAASPQPDSIGAGPAQPEEASEAAEAETEEAAASVVAEAISETSDIPVTAEGADGDRDEAAVLAAEDADAEAFDDVYEEDLADEAVSAMAEADEADLRAIFAEDEAEPATELAVETLDDGETEPFELPAAAIASTDADPRDSTETATAAMADESDVSVSWDEADDGDEFDDDGEDDAKPSFFQRARARVIKVGRATAEDLRAEDHDDTAERPAAVPILLDQAARLPSAEAEDRDVTDGRTILEGEAATDNEAVARLMEEANTKLEGAESRRRFSAIAHLKAAVAATVADRKMKEKDVTIDSPDDEGGIDLYRDDLSKAVRPRRPAAEGQTVTSRPTVGSRQAPLVLVSAQRIDEPGNLRNDPGIVRPRRVSSGNLAVDDDMDADEDETDVAISPEEARNFADFAERLGATNLPELLEAAAVYTATVEGRPHFSRPHILNKVAYVADDDGFNREDGLRSFGMLLRQGKIQKVRRGQFVVTNTSRFMSEARRAAQ